MRYTAGLVFCDTEVHHLTKVLRLAEQLAVDMEADKHLETMPEAVEVKLLKAIKVLEENDGITVDSLRQTMGLPTLSEDQHD